MQTVFFFCLLRQTSSSSFLYLFQQKKKKKLLEFTQHRYHTTTSTYSKKMKMFFVERFHYTKCYIHVDGWMAKPKICDVTSHFKFSIFFVENKKNVKITYFGNACVQILMITIMMMMIENIHAACQYDDILY